VQADSVDGFGCEYVDMGDGSESRTRVTLRLQMSLIFPLGSQTDFFSAMALENRAVVFGAQWKHDFFFAKIANKIISRDTTKKIVGAG